MAADRNGRRDKEMHPMNILHFTRDIFKRYPGKFFVLLLAMFLSNTLGCIGFTLFIPAIGTFMGDSSVKDSGILSVIKNILISLSVPYDLQHIFMLIAAILLLSFLVMFFERLLRANIGAAIQVQFQRQLVTGLMESDWRFASSQKIGTIQNIVNTETIYASDAFRFLCDFYAGLFTFLVYLGGSCLISIHALVAIGILSLLIFPFTDFFIRRVGRTAEQVVTNNNSRNQRIIEILQGLRFIKSVGIGDLWRGIAEEFIDRGGRLARKSQIYHAMIQIVPMAIAGIGMLVVLYLGLKVWHIAIAELAVFMLLINRAYSGVAAIKQKQGSVVRNIPSFYACLELLRKLDDHLERRNAGDYPGLKREVKLQNVSFSYGHKQIIEKVNITIPVGKTIALVGRSGSGKSTVIDILTGLLQPDSGSVTIDGRPLKEIDVQQWRSRIGYVSQNTFLSNDTVLRNIGMCRQDATQEEIVAAAEAAYAKHFIEDKQGGFDAVLHDAGGDLSGGERQRISLARALLRKPDILILDEATSALDNESEKRIQEVVQNLSGNLTIIQIAHRLSTVKGADRIYVIDEGRIVESGTFQELLDKQGYFFDMYSITQ